ncbi:TPA: DUF1627 domain-containing protein [Escherichia coli]|uniref:DUF1627 domain-containing protein n=1 Tax=Escherichia coli TaxID=562 RepID=UPI0015E99B62|nr:DUF1627 domain-containing protein [Escherichia coli]EJJ0958433.1 DUF1627 domain-containing protein [Escherichia coli]EJV8882874.1 DUF1627 domain-containing protein [Escherichia coli]MCV5585153.1 DUF1627 domain-containing protein [Escherichia coli]MDY5573538.1 DUF1627 domain-containing protein [Escherichia coli]QMM78358.1 DUF1627 domain-containing protein [Escherichia coli]
MESMVDALKVMGKATSVELAARLQMSREEVLSALWELKRDGVVEQESQTWMLVSDSGRQEQKTSAVARQSRKIREVISRKERHPLNREDIINALKQGGELTTVDVAVAVGRGDCARSLVPAMEKLCRDGLVVKRGHGRGVKWELVKKDGDDLPVAPEAEAAVISVGKSEVLPGGEVLPVLEPTERLDGTQSAVGIMQSLTSSFTEKYDNYVVLPSLHMANRELRRAKCNVKKWERICAALREINKHRDVIQKITTGDNG